mgnify:CR=1 FL=1
MPLNSNGIAAVVECQWELIAALKVAMCLQLLTEIAREREREDGSCTVQL